MNDHERKFSFRCGQRIDGTVIGLIGVWRWEWIIINACANPHPGTYTHPGACANAHTYTHPGTNANAHPGAYTHTCANANPRQLHHWWRCFGSGHRSLGGVAE
jgi:hypothetical protein